MRLYPVFRTSFMPAVILLTAASFVVPAISAKSHASSAEPEHAAAIEAHNQTHNSAIGF